MAELTVEAGRSRKRQRRRSKKLSTRVDLTPMVDLGFLLITFFFVTTTWAKPHAMKVNLPANGDNTVLGRNAALTVLAGKDNTIFYYHGILEEALRDGSYGIIGYGGIRDIIMQKQKAMDQFYQGGRKELMLLVKASPNASYRNIVDLLDEMRINLISKYALMDLTPEEKKLLRDKNL
jgi:biopolymer transport protein ExbD